MFKRLVNFFPIFGLLFAAWGVYGLFGPDGQAATAAVDPSLNDAGFDPAILTPTTQMLATRSWVQLPSSATETPAAAAADLPGPEPTRSERGLAQVSEPVDPPAVPDRIVIPSIDLDAPVVVAPTRQLTIQQQVFEQWLAPDAFAVGWHTGTAFLGEPGNTVLNGHHNVFGKVFGHLVDLKPGDEIILYSGTREFHYVVAQTMVLREKGASLAERETNAQWISPSTDERLTLVTCWPADNNTHRLVVVASPIHS